MEALGLGLEALGKSIGICARSFAMIYIVGIGCKTFLIYTGKASMDSFKDWFKFKNNDYAIYETQSVYLKINL